MVGDGQSSLYLFLLILANVIPLVNRYFANVEAKNQTKSIIKGTAAQTTVVEVGQKVDTGASVMLARLARVEKQLGIPEPKPEETALYIPIEKKEK